MDLASIVAALQNTGLAEWLRTSLKAMPIVESVHVMALALVFGSILIVDLRLLGIPSTRRAVTKVADELLSLTWGAFGVSVVTGALLFIVNATTYYNNMAFRWKMVALLAAGLNMAIFQRVTFKSVAGWNKDVSPPAAARLAGALSILIWTTVIVLGRWIGFTKGYDFGIPEDVQFDFDFSQ
jgi:hypothetical protein